MNLDSQEPLEALPMPDSAVELEVSSGIQTFRQMVIATLKQVLKDRRLASLTESASTMRIVW